MLKAKDRVLIQRDVFTVMTDEADGWATFKREHDGYTFIGYTGRLVEKLQPMNTAPMDGTRIKLLDQLEVFHGYHDKNPDIGWTTDEGATLFTLRACFLTVGHRFTRPRLNNGGLRK